MDPKRIQQIMFQLNIPPERQKKAREKIWLVWAERVEELVIAQEALGFPEIKDLLARISRG